MRLWGFPFSLPKLTGNSCLVVNNANYDFLSLSPTAGELSSFYGSCGLSLWFQRSCPFSENLTCFNSVVPVNYSTEALRLCGILVVHNLAFPEWFPVSCHEKLPVDVVCTKEPKGNYSQYNNTVKRSVQCQEKQIAFDKQCLFMEKGFSKETILPQNTSEQSQNSSSAVPEQIVRVISKVSKLRLVFCFPFVEKCVFYNSQTDTVRVVAKLTLEKHITTVQGTLFQEVQQIIRGKSQLVECSSGEFISIKHFQDRKPDCVSGDDEVGLKCYVEGNVRNDSMCCTDCFSSQGCQCADLHYQSVKGGCYTYSKLTEVKLEGGTHTHTSPQNADCTAQEIKAFKSNTFSVIPVCTAPDELPCTYGCSTCFSISKLCVYEVHHQKEHIMHCPSGAHLKNCEDMQCNNMFKCFQSFCVPYR